MAESTGDEAGAKAAMVATLGAELGIPCCVLDSIGTGAGSFVGEHCPDAAAIREHLAGVKKFLVEKGLLVDRRQAARGWADRAAGDEDFLAAIGANRPGGGARFNEAVLGVSVADNAAGLDEALGIRHKSNGFAKSITR
jgi:hypothetical protein